VGEWGGMGGGGGDFRVAEDAALATGNLEVVLVDRVGRLLRADILTRILARRPLDRSMRSFTARELRATSPALMSPCSSTAKSGDACRCPSASNPAP
jgi:hypothetical protein